MVNLKFRTGGQTWTLGCFGLDAGGKLWDAKYFVFHGQKATPCGAVTLRGAGEMGVNTGSLPAQVQRLVFTAALDGDGTMGALTSGDVQIRAGGRVVAILHLSPADFGAERSVMLVEVYLKEVWRLAAVGQGFAGGVEALVRHFGGQVPAALMAAASPPPPPARPAAAPLPSPFGPGPGASPPPPPPLPRSSPPAAGPGMGAAGRGPSLPMPRRPGQGMPYGGPAGAGAVPPPPPVPVSLRKVTLEKQGEKKKISLAKGGTSQPVHVNLNWDKLRKRGFGLFGGGQAADLDLGCMYLLRDGSMGCVQALGNSFGNRNGPPYIYLDKDDRSGQADDGENLWILKPELIERVLVFAFIYEGVANFGAVNGRLVLKEQDGSETLIRLDAPSANETFCGICLVQQVGDGVEITKETRYFRGHPDADRHYGFGFRWKDGSK